VPALVWPPHGRTMTGDVQISVLALMHVLKLGPKAGGYPGNGMHLYGLTGLHTTNHVIACSLIYNRNLVYDEGTRPDYCDMISAASDLGRLYFMSSCRLAPTDATPVLHGSNAAVWPHVF
jgi:hypothetical protein